MINSYKVRTCSLVDVLIRFRQDRTALVADIEAMFHQVKVPQADTTYLRFLWWPCGNLSMPVKSMTVYLFGAKSSPSCTAFCLRRTADDNKAHFSKEAVQAVKRHFYVDDFLKSMSSTSEGIELC